MNFLNKKKSPMWIIYHQHWSPVKEADFDIFHLYDDVEAFSGARYLANSFLIKESEKRLGFKVVIEAPLMITEWITQSGLIRPHRGMWLLKA